MDGCARAAFLVGSRYEPLLAAASGAQETAKDTSEQAASLLIATRRTQDGGFVDSQSQRRAEDLLDSIFKVATELVRGERASLLLREDNSTDFVIARAIGLADDVMRRVRVKTGEGVVGLVAQSRRPLLVRHVSSAPIQSGEGTYRSDSFVSVPILVGDDSRGVLSVTDRNDGKPFDDADLETLELLAGHIGQVLVMQEQGEALQRLAETDPLTWLFNRRHFDRRLEAETNRALRRSEEHTSELQSQSNLV